MDETNIKKRLSIIVPVYNVEKYIERCLLSLLNQDIPKSEYEIIVVNDGTPDNSADIAQSIADKNENIIVIHRENGGLSAARNTGMEYVHGEYVMFVDSDDWVEEYTIGKILTKAKDNSLDLCFFDSLLEHEDGTSKKQSHDFEKEIIYNGEYLILHGMKVTSVWQNIYSTAFLQKTNIRFYEGIVHEDLDYNYRLYPLAKRVMFTNLTGYHYRVFGESILRTNNPNKIKNMIDSSFYIVRSIWDNTNNSNYSKEIQTHYYRYGNSMVVSNIIRIITDKRLDINMKKNSFEIVHKLSLYPVPGRTLSWKTTLLKYLLNQEWLLKLLI